jgi:hypothetical protein
MTNGPARVVRGLGIGEPPCDLLCGSRTMTAMIPLRPATTRHRHRDPPKEYPSLLVLDARDELPRLARHTRPDRWRGPCLRGAWCGGAWCGGFGSAGRPRSHGRVSEINFHHSARRLSFEGVRVLTKGLSVLETQSILKRANSFLSPPYFLNPLGAISSSSDASSSRALQSNPRECRSIQENAEQCRERQDNAEQSKRLQERTAQNRAIQENAELHRFIPEISKKIQRVELRQGGVLFNKTASAARDVFDVRAAALG